MTNAALRGKPDAGNPHRPAPWYAGPEDNAVCIKDGCAHLKIIEKDGQLKSPQLQTGGLLWDIPQILRRLPRFRRTARLTALTTA